MLPDRHPDMAVLGRADSVALDPHKWLYAPLEAGCALVRDEVAMRAAFSYHPDYYKFKDESDDRVANMVDFGPQNSRGFRALKVWLSLKQAGRRGYESMIREDIALAKRLYDAAIAHPLLQAFDCNLSIATFRYLPDDLDVDADGAETYLNALNEELLTRLQAGGEAFVSNAVIAGAYVLRACVVNFRTTNADVDAVPEIVIRLGAAVDAELRPDALKS